MYYKDIIEAIYIIYMYNYFQTNISIHHPFEYILNNYSLGHFLRHPIDTGIKESKICPLGNLAGWLLGIWVLLRHILEIYDSATIYKINKTFFLILLLSSLIMNLNAFVYMIPVFIYELILK